MASNEHSSEPTGRPFVRVGLKMRRTGDCSLTVTSWAPYRTDVEILRDRLGLADTRMTDEALQAVIDGAKAWIRGRRYSWVVVASNYLRDGRYHARLAK